MASDGRSVERLRAYLRTLSIEARTMLVEELERNLVSGGENADDDRVLQELRQSIRADTQAAPRISDIARLFFAPLEPFLIDARADHKRIGRIARVLLEPIWAWINRDLIPAEAKALGDDIERALASGDQDKAEHLIHALHDRALQRMRDTASTIGTDEKARRRLAVHVGTPRAAEDLGTLICILSLRNVLADLAGRLPHHIGTLDGDQIDSIKVLLDDIAGQADLDAGGLRKADFLRYSLILVADRLTAPWQLIRLATRAADSDEAGRIAETPYGSAVAIVFSETESLVSDLRVELKSGRPIGSILKRIHDSARGLRSEIDLSADSAWSRQLAAIRGDVSALLKAEIEATPAAVRRLLRPRPAKEIAPGAVLDSMEVAETESRVEYVGACRHYASELAINELSARAHSELTLYLETGTRVLIDSLRYAGDADGPFRESQVDVAIRFCRITFGPEYAKRLAKAAEVARQAAATDRKALSA